MSSSRFCLEDQQKQRLCLRTCATGLEVFVNKRSRDQRRRPRSCCLRSLSNFSQDPESVISLLHQRSTGSVQVRVMSSMIEHSSNRVNDTAHGCPAFSALACTSSEEQSPTLSPRVATILTNETALITKHWIDLIGIFAFVVTSPSVALKAKHYESPRNYQLCEMRVCGTSRSCGARGEQGPGSKPSDSTATISTGEDAFPCCSDDSCLVSVLYLHHSLRGGNKDVEIDRIAGVLFGSRKGSSGVLPERTNGVVVGFTGYKASDK